MGRCRYNLSEECRNKDCVKCILEKIKAEIQEEREEMANEKDWGRYYGLNLSLAIIDDHIAELKGEKE